MFEYDWRSPEAYQRSEKADATAIAWEWLRRSKNFRDDCRQSASNLRLGETFRSKWGLCFRP